ncbi:MAG: hypothetical protein Ta2A_16000 [Treponemataceae bacterium]|nr:MAG: hypothetical protein Ta2A_16000 [Treponemataceae bacterium]
MTNHTKKIIAPVIVIILVIAYCAAFFLWPFGLAALVAEAEMEKDAFFPLVVMILFIVIPVAVVFGSIYVLIERIKEINKGEEDDLSKY